MVAFKQMAQRVKQFKKAGKFEIRRLLFTLILILRSAKSIKISRQIYQNFNRPLSFSYAHRTYSNTCSTRPRKATFTTRPVCLRAAEPCHRSGAQRGFTSREINGKRHGAPPGTVRSTLPRDPSLTESSRPQLLCGCCVVGRCFKQTEFKII